MYSNLETDQHRRSSRDANMSVATHRIAVIGAGPSGLSLLRSFSKAEESGTKIPEIVCFEKQSDVGGMWNLTWRTGLDEHGETVHSSMYRNLWVNAPKECYEYPDYTFDEHFGRPVPSYLERESFRDYILGRAAKSNVRRFIRFDTVVRLVEFNEQCPSGRFTIRSHDLLTGKDRTDRFDYLVVATSHFTVPNMPPFDGTDQFPGRIIHSRDFRNAEEFAGQNVLIIGRHYSAEDIASQIYKFGAKSATISYRSKPTGLKWPEGIEERPLLARIQGKTAHFADGSQRDVDCVIFCTGYKHHFPFMPDNLRLVTANRSYPEQLYKGIFFQDQPRCIYLGMQDLTFTTTMFEAQAWYARDVILGRIQLPEAQSRHKDIQSWLAKEAHLNGLPTEIDFQAEYIADLIEAIADYPELHLKTVGNMLKTWNTDKKESIIGYRDKRFTSVFTGTKASANPVPWIEAGRQN